MTVIYNVGGTYNEDLDWLLTLWENYFMRGPVVFDEDASVAIDYRHPRTGLPFGRGFIIDQQSIVDTPYFGHRPRQAIKRIYELLDTAGVGRGGPEPETASRILLENRGPNPFTSSTTLRYKLPERARVDLAVFDVTGRLVIRLESGYLDAGMHETVWNRDTGAGALVPSGIYFCRLTAHAGSGESHAILKLVVLE